MPANVDDMGEGLKISRVNGKLVGTRSFFCTDLSGATDLERLAETLALTSDEGTHTGLDIPKDGESITLLGKTLYANNFEVSPWGVSDSQCTVTWDTNKRTNFDVAGFGPTIKEVGGSAEEEETDFDYDNLQLPLAERVRIRVRYDANSTVAPGIYPAASHKPADARVRRFANKPVLVFTREQTVDPEPLAVEHVATTNSVEWRGYAIGTVLCVSIVGRDVGTGIWTTTYVFAVNKHGWKQYARYTLPETGQPPLLETSQIANQNGILEVTVQGTSDFTALGIPT